MTQEQKAKATKLSLRDKAKKAACRSRCLQCKFWHNGLCSVPEVAQVCYENYVKGYIKGYNQRKVEERQ